MFAEIVAFWFRVDEGVGVALGVLAVLCLIREKLLAWPLGVAYVLVIVPQLWQAQLIANFTLHVVGFLPLNLYGWYHWLFGGEDRNDLPVTRASVGLLGILAALCLAATLALGWALDTYTDAAFPYWDNGVLTMSLAAMWLTAQKKIDNWLVWVAVDAISVPLYYAQGLPWYAALYMLYLPMAAWGYATWRRSMRLQSA